MGRATFVCLALAAGCSNDIAVSDTTDPPSVEIIVPIDGGEFDPLQPLAVCGRVGGNQQALSLASDVDGVLAIDGDFTPCPGGNAGATVLLSDADHTLELVVTDHRGRQASDSVRVLASPNDAPGCAIALPLDDAAYEEGLDVPFESTVTDERLAEVEVTVVSDLDGTVFTGTPGADGAVDTTLQGLSVGDHTLAMSAVDPRGEVALCTVSVSIVECVDLDADGVSTCDGDCDDGDPAVFPGATELPNGVDDDCDGTDDEGTDLFDDDGDGFSELDGDCDDADIAIFPGEVEVPDDGIDQDCSGSDTVSCFADADLDTVGSLVVVLAADGDCFDPGEALSFDDCNDADPTVFPGAVEVLNDGIDQDCDGTDAVGCYVDGDGDTFGDTATVIASYDGDCDDPGETAVGGDCDDALASVYPGAPEVVGDGIDQDCDGFDTVTCFVDGDLDGFGSTLTQTATDGDCLDAGESALDTDCDDAAGSVFPGAIEVVDDGTDQDCDGFDTITCFDDGDFDGFGTSATVLAADGDCLDAGESTLDTDCNDAVGTIFPGAPEVADDGTDQDCNGFDTVTCFVDGDLDGVGGATTLLAADGDCADGGESTLGTDCDDGDSARYPGAVEVPDNGVDEDCSGDDTVSCVVDADLDGFGTDLGTVVLAADGDCADSGESLTADDCDDGNAAVNPGAGDTFGNGVDEDCDGADGIDADGDGFASGFSGGTDCDDGDAGINPGAAELRDALDQNCDGFCDEGLIGAGDVVITELMINPSAVADTVGEWFELKNVTGVDIALCDGWSFSDLGGNGFSVADPGALIPAGGYAVFAVEANAGLNGGVVPDVVYAYAASGGMQLGQSGDELIVDFDGTLIDEFLWSAGFDPTGASKQAAGGFEDATDNDLEGNWCTATTAMSGGDAGTPGSGPDC